MMDTKLNTLLRVQEEGSFTRAAEALSLTQPAVSKHIRLLEEELGVRIFNRGEGEMVAKYAKRIEVLYSNMRQSLKDQKHRATRLSVGMTHTAESNVMAEVLARYSSERQGVCLTIFTDTIQNLYAKLQTYEIDLAIVEGRSTDSSFNSILLDTDCLILAVSTENPLAKQNIVTLSELKKQKMILRLPNSGTRNLFVSHLESNNLSLDDFNVILEVDNIATIKDLIRRNFGVSILAKSACMDELRKGKLVALPVENLSMIREINLVYHRDFEHVDILRDISKMYFEYGKQSD